MVVVCRRARYAAQRSPAQQEAGAGHCVPAPAVAKSAVGQVHGTCFFSAFGSSHSRRAFASFDCPIGKASQYLQVTLAPPSLGRYNLDEITANLNIHTRDDPRPVLFLSRVVARSAL